VIEIDGSQHSQVEAIEEDKVRDRYLADLGLEVIRVNSRAVLANTDEVVEAVYQKMRAKVSD
jgi:very-short-patch-repair endonuclease